jgi:hypothetical protein
MSEGGAIGVDLEFEIAPHFFRAAPSELASSDTATPPLIRHDASPPTASTHEQLEPVLV